MKLLLSILIFCNLSAFAKQQSMPELGDIKNELITLAESYKGQADPDFKIQDELLILVERLIELSPQEPVEQRLDLLVGAWKQVWGPYEYRKNDRSVDPKTDAENIYQVVFPQGYYYNVGNKLNKKTKEVKSVTLLRGEYNFEGGDDLKVKFTKLTRVKRLPNELSYIDLPELSEDKSLKGERKSLPNWLVKLTFKGGTLSEIYTDKDLRLAIGKSKSKNGIQSYLYVMTRVN